MPIQQCICGDAWYRGSNVIEPDTISAEDTLKCINCNGIWIPNYSYFGSGVVTDKSYDDYCEDGDYVEHLQLEGCYEYANAHISPFRGCSKVKGTRKKGISTWLIDKHGPKLKHSEKILLDELKWALFHIHSGKSDSEIPLHSMYVRKIAMLLGMEPDYALKTESRDSIVVKRHGVIAHVRPEPKYRSGSSRSYPPEWVHIILKRDNYRCVECGNTNKYTRLEIDHIIPFSKGGKSVLSNLQTLCHECNMAKFDRIWED